MACGLLGRRVPIWLDEKPPLYLQGQLSSGSTPNEVGELLMLVSNDRACFQERQNPCQSFGGLCKIGKGASFICKKIIFACLNWCGTLLRDKRCNIHRNGLVVREEPTFVHAFVHKHRDFFAAQCPNGRLSRRMAARDFLRLPQFSRCARSQHENRIHRMGSKQPFAAI